MEFSKEQINFLDVNISQKEGALQTEPYCKPADTHQFLHFGSCPSLYLQKVNPVWTGYSNEKICSNEEKLSS